MKIIAIDPGLKGGWALLERQDKTRLIDYGRMPIWKARLSLSGTERTQVDVLALKRLFITRAIFTVVTEYQTAMPGQSSVATGTTFLNWGLVLSLRSLATLHVVHPRVWKNHFRLGNDKKAAIATAIHLFPSLGTKVPPDGVAEAILIGHYWLEKGSATAEAAARKAKPKPRRAPRHAASSPSSSRSAAS